GHASSNLAHSGHSLCFRGHVIAIAPSGKTLAYLLPMVHQCSTVMSRWWCYTHNIPTARGSFGRQSLYKHVEVLSGDSGSVFTNLGSQGWLNALGDTIRNNSSLLHSPSDSVKDDTLWDLDKTLDVAERKWQSLMRRWGLDDIADSYNNYH
ncbi:hypothetical protein Pmar_PMAR022867, partial [Perkinsus marinus ATCC 50983]